MAVLFSKSPKETLDTLPRMVMYLDHTVHQSFQFFRAEMLTSLLSQVTEHCDEVPTREHAIIVSIVDTEHPLHLAFQRIGRESGNKLQELLKGNGPALVLVDAVKHSTNEQRRMGHTHSISKLSLC